MRATHEARSSDLVCSHEAFLLARVINASHQFTRRDRSLGMFAMSQSLCADRSRFLSASKSVFIIPNLDQSTVESTSAPRRVTGPSNPGSQRITRYGDHPQCATSDAGRAYSLKARFTASSASSVCLLSVGATQLRHHHESAGRAASSASIAILRISVDTGWGSQSVTPGTPSFQGRCSPDGKLAAMTAAAVITSSGSVMGDLRLVSAKADWRVRITKSKRLIGSSEPNSSRKSSAVSLSKGLVPHVPNSNSSP